MKYNKYSSKEMIKNQERTRQKAMLDQLNKDCELQALINIERDFEFAMEEVQNG